MSDYFQSILMGSLLTVAVSLASAAIATVLGLLGASAKLSGRRPLVVLATMATVIASQAVISGAFSITRQAVQLGYLPRLRILHTSARTQGQIYIPFINWTLLILVILGITLVATVVICRSIDSLMLCPSLPWHSHVPSHSWQVLVSTAYARD